MKIVTAHEMRSLDRRAIEEYGIPGAVLMENAALQTTRLLRGKYRRLLKGEVFIFCGKGNNGGDGFAIGRHLGNAGFGVTLFLLTGEESVKGDAAVNLRVDQKMGLPVRVVTTSEGLRSLRDTVSGRGLVIDAIFGTGLTSAAAGFYREAIDFINTLPNPVVSVDIPSGLNADTGRVDGPCVRAELTVTFALPKRAHYLTPASNFVGCLEVADIGIPARLMDEMETAVETLDRRECFRMLGPRPKDSHKGNYGHLVVVGGSPGKGGAPAMAALAALRSGTGLVTLAVPERVLKTGVPEAMSLSLPETADGFLAGDAGGKLLPFLQDKNAVVFGPGMGTHPDTERILAEVVENVSRPLVIDADGLNLLAHNKDFLKHKKGEIILTPHPGEMARLMGISTKEVQDRRLKVAMDFAKGTGCILILKGAGTVVAAPEGRAYINTTGNTGMATAGTGDALAGIIGGLLAQGHDPEDAARLGVFLHGMAGDLAARKYGERSLIAGDLIDALPMALVRLGKEKKE